MHVNVYDVFHLLNPHHHVSVVIAAIFRVILLKERKCTNVISWVAVIP